MTLEDLQSLIDYNYWARDRILGAIDAITPEQFVLPLGSSFKSVRDTVAHICDAERIWITRLRGGEPLGLQPPDRTPNANASRLEWTRLERELRKLVADLDPNNTEYTVEYRDLGGNDQSDPIWQILQHVVNHGTYHRGQITTMLRQLNATPPKPMDLIAFYRERKEKA